MLCRMKKILFLLCAFSVTAFAAPKEYFLTSLRPVVFNHNQCSAFYHDLKKISKDPIRFEFSPTSKGGEHAVRDLSGLRTGHRYRIIQQTVKNGRLNRFGLGSFQMKDQKIDYVIHVTANLNNPNHHYLYPVLFTSHEGNCSYSGILDPTDATENAFKRRIQSGHAARGTDLLQK